MVIDGAGHDGDEYQLTYVCPPYRRRPRRLCERIRKGWLCGGWARAGKRSIHETDMGSKPDLMTGRLPTIPEDGMDGEFDTAHPVLGGRIPYFDCEIGTELTPCVGFHRVD